MLCFGSACNVSVHNMVVMLIIVIFVLVYSFNHY